MRVPHGPTSLRGRLALLFAIGSASLLVGSAAFLYLNLNAALEQSVNNGLRARADDIDADVAAGSVQVRQVEAFAELLSADGRVIDASSTIADSSRPVLTRAEIAAALRHEIVVDRAVPGLGEDARLLARVDEDGPTTVVVVVGTSRRLMVRARARLAVTLSIASPFLVGVLAGGAWLLAGAALRPVRRMTQEADEISLDVRRRRLPQPSGDDEIARLGRTLNAMLDRIEVSFDREQAFVDDASHELRTPISILRAELELALLQPGDAAQVEESLRSALEEAERLGRLAEDLLVLSRASAGRLSLHRQPVDLDALATRVASRMALEEGPPTDVETGHVTVSGDPARVEQVLVNLVANARRFATSLVRIEVRRVGGGAEVIVADDGPGFAAEILPKAFDRLTRGDHVRGRNRGGAGLGLAIVAAIVQAHGWTIEAGNGPPLGGAVVRIGIPPASPRAAAARTERP